MQSLSQVPLDNGAQPADTFMDYLRPNAGKG